MAMTNKELDTAAQMATVNLTTSAEIMETVRDTRTLAEFQKKLTDSKERVEIAKNILINIEAHELTPEVAQSVDELLERSFKEVGFQDSSTEEIETVGGVESLGYTLKPSQFIFTRLNGCENFLKDFYVKTKETLGLLSGKVKNAKQLLTTSVDDIHKSIEALEKLVDKTEDYGKNVESIHLGVRLFNLFKVNGVVSEDWEAEFSKLERVVTALVKDYHMNKRNHMTKIMSYFGGFEKSSVEEAIARLTKINSGLPSVPFKGCTIKDKEESDNLVEAKRSVELLGGAYFIDKRLLPSVAKAGSKESQEYSKEIKEEDIDNKQLGKMEEELASYRLRLEKEDVIFIKKGETVLPNLKDEVKTLTLGQIKSLVKLMKSITDNWAKIYQEEVEKVLRDDKEFVEIRNSILNIHSEDFDKYNQLRSTIADLFTASVIDSKQELLNTAKDVTFYLTLTLNGLIELSTKSIKANAN